MSHGRWIVGRLWQLIRSHAGLLGVVFVALVFRLVYLQWFKAFPPGDVFNFIGIAQGLSNGEYSPTEKRLPFYPLLILLLHPVLDWEVAAVAIAVIASLAVLATLYAIGRTLGLSKTALAVSLLVFQAQPQFLIASTRGYADTTFLALTLASLLGVFRTRSWKGAVVSGVLLGAASLTRYEALVVSVMLLPFWVLFPRRLPRRVPLVALGVFLLTLLPYVVLSTATGRTVFGSGYLEQAAAGSYGADSVREVLTNARGIWQRAGLLGLWVLLQDTVRDIRYDPLGTPRVLAAKLVEPTLIFTAAALLGLVVFVARRKFWDVLVVALAFLAITIPVAWWQPLRRFDVFVMPAVVLLSAAGITALQGLLVRGTAGRAGLLVRYGMGTLLLLVTGSFWLPHLAEQTRHTQAKHNGREFAFYQAIHAARSLPGIIVFDDLGRGITNIYFRGRSMASTGVESSDTTPRGILAALRSRGATYAVVAAGKESQFPFLSEPGVEVEAAFEWPTVNDNVSRATIYQISGAP